MRQWGWCRGIWLKRCEAAGDAGKASAARLEPGLHAQEGDWSGLRS